MKVILGTGQLGLAILDVLLKNNPTEEIMLVNRSGKIARSIPANVQLLAGDVTDKHEMEFIAREAEIIYCCIDVPYSSWKDYYPAAASALAYAMSKTNARLVFADNMYSYGNVSGAIMNENLPHQAKTKKGMIRTSVINTLLLSGETFNKRVAFVKAADFIGPRIHKGIFGTDFLQRLYNGKTIMLFGNPNLPHTFTYIYDFADAMVNIGNSADAFGTTWHVPNAPAISLLEWIRLFELETGSKAIIRTLPKIIVRVAALFNALISEFIELAYQFEFPYLVDHSKYSHRFGNRFTSHIDIVKRTIEAHEYEVLD